MVALYEEMIRSKFHRQIKIIKQFSEKSLDVFDILPFYEEGNTNGKFTAFDARGFFCISGIQGEAVNFILY